MERRTLPPEMPSALVQYGCPGSGEHADRGSRCLNLMAALRPMPLARWQYLKIFGTGHQSAFLPMCLCACVPIHSCTTPVNCRACLALLAVLILIPSCFQAITPMHY